MAHMVKRSVSLRNVHEFEDLPYVLLKRVFVCFEQFLDITSLVLNHTDPQQWVLDNAYPQKWSQVITPTLKSWSLDYICKSTVAFFDGI